MVDTIRPSRRARAVLVEFLGSMNLAITLLVAICIAAVIGTVLQQNQSYPDYVAKFGPFWFEVFKRLGLFDIYGTAWFVTLLGALLVSTSVCIYRNAPSMLRDMRRVRLDVQDKSLRGFHHHAEWEVPNAPEAVISRASAVLEANGYRVHRKDHEGRFLLAGVKGSWNRLGYLATHLSIVVICLGGLINGNLPLKVAEQLGRIKVETRDIPASEVPPESTLSPDNLAFRGNVRIPEGSAADFVFLNVRDGYLLQKLPFSIELKDFRIEHYPTGQPKSFESDLVIHDPSSPKPVTRTIAVNHPFFYKGFAIYQASFSDGGSQLKLKAWSLDAPALKPLELQGAVYQNLKVVTPRGPFTIELTDFKEFNVLPAMEGSGKEFQNYGPSVVFKLRNEAGEAMEYVNYMVPVPSNGRAYYVSGVRGSPAESYRYLYIPTDAKGGIDRFMRLRARLFDEEELKRVVAKETDEMVAAGAKASMKKELSDSMLRLANLFARGGMDAIATQVDKTVSQAERSKAMQSYILVLQNLMGAVYVDVLKEEGVAVDKGISKADAQFFDDALEAMAAMGNYGSPLFLQLTNFKEIQATGLQITRAPGKDILILGFVMLMAGVFFMFYVHHRRMWISVAGNGNSTRVLFAGSGNRDRFDFGKEFDALRALLDTSSTAKQNQDAAGHSDNGR